MHILLAYDGSQHAIAAVDLLQGYPSRPARPAQRRRRRVPK